MSLVSPQTYKIILEKISETDFYSTSRKLFLMSTPSLEPKSITFRIGDIPATIFRHQRKVLVTFFSILLLGVAVILFAPRTYNSEAKLFLQIGRESVTLDPTATTGKTIAMQAGDRANEIVTVIDMIMSRGIAEKVVDHAGIDVVLGRGNGGGDEGGGLLSGLVSYTIGLPFRMIGSIDPISERERAIITVENSLKVYAEEDSTLIAVQYQAKTPELAQLVAQAVVDVYREDHLRIHRTTGSKEFFEDQVSVLGTQLDEAVDRLQTARNRMNIGSIEARRSSLEGRLNDIEATRYSTLQQLSSAQALAVDIRKQISAMPERIVSTEISVPNTGADLLHSQLYGLQVLMLEQQAKYNDDHPILQATKLQLEEAESMLEKVSSDRVERTQDVNPNHSALALSLANAESNLASLEALWSELDKQRSTVLADLKQLNDNELEIDQLNRETQLARTNFFRYSENLEEARIDRELDNERISNVIVAQAATLWHKPVSPGKAMIAILTFAVALASVALLVLACEMLDKCISTKQQLEDSLQLPVFGVVPDDRKFSQVLAN